MNFMGTVLRIMRYIYKKNNPTKFYVVERPTAVTATEIESRAELSEFVQGREGMLLDEDEFEMCERQLLHVLSQTL